MDNWFTVESIDDKTFAISEYRHFEKTHCYLILGEEKAALIDTGLGVSNIKNVVDNLTKLPITVLTTHVHWDHIGGHKHFDSFAVHEAEKSWISCGFPLPLKEVKNQLTKSPRIFPKDFDIDKYKIFKGEPKIILHDGDFLDLGERILCVIHTPGHSPGHCCFYEPKRKYLFSGDLIYKGCLYAFYPTTDPQLFYKSLKKIKNYNIEKILPGHNDLNISTSLIEKVELGFEKLHRESLLKHESGLFDFGDFQIKI